LQVPLRFNRVGQPLGLRQAPLVGSPPRGTQNPNEQPDDN
jgi:hypothetical protein